MNSGVNPGPSQRLPPELADRSGGPVAASEEAAMTGFRRVDRPRHRPTLKGFLGELPGGS